MGQTLTHGIYLPNKGERNCYNGLAANWQLLDGAVGTVADHTAQIAGKAPAVHTHTKSDVTDLLNSNFIPSANNSYDLGSSSYQWNNVYSKGYYYNGTPWGLDKYNQWTEVNDFNDLIGLNGAELWFKNINIDDITANPSADTGKSVVQIWNKGTTQYCGGIIDSLDTSGTHVFEIVNFGYPLNSINAYQHRFRFASKRDGTASFYPTYPNVDLGTSANKWKTLNGINPGALSLPIGSYVAIDTSNWDLTGATGQSYTPTVHGWLFISIQNIAGNYLSIVSGRGAISIDGTGAQNGLRAMLPVIANESVGIIVKTGVIFAARFYPMQGNV